MTKLWPNHPAAGKAGITSRLATKHHCPGLPEPGRWAAVAHFMELRRLIWFAIVFLTFLRSVSGQGFVNLDFESATLVPVPGDNYNGVYFAQAFPGWTKTIVGGFYPNALYDGTFLDSAGISIIDRSGLYLPGGGGLIQGNYTAILQSGLGVIGPSIVLADTTLSQTGLVPVGTRSLQFKAYEAFDSQGTFDVTLGGQALSLGTIGYGPNYTLYGADVSAWAGQTAELAFTVPAENPHVNDEYLYLDAIQFSTQSIPEPNALSLFSICILILCRRVKRPNKAIHRMSGTHICSRFGWLGMPLIGDLVR
jgi:hypothetical protein